jgi:hypothetical protein
VGNTIQSWTENAYQIGSTDQLVSAMADVALSFSAFAYGSPSHNGAFVKVVRSPMFIPFPISGQDAGLLPDPAQIVAVAQFFGQAVDQIGVTQLALYPLPFERATASRFLGPFQQQTRSWDTSTTGCSSQISQMLSACASRGLGA